MPADWLRPLDVDRHADAGDSWEFELPLTQLPRLAQELATVEGAVVEDQRPRLKRRLQLRPPVVLHHRRWQLLPLLLHQRRLPVPLHRLQPVLSLAVRQR